MAAMATLCSSAAALAQPSLFPPGPPVGPSGRMGVRTEITALPYVISAPGSYYLSATLFQGVPGPGITIDASNVTIDLMGFALIGGPFPGDDAITFGPGFYENVTVHNGFVAFWGDDGLDLVGGGGPAPGIHVDTVTAFSNTGDGVTVGPRSIIRHVISHSNGGVGVRLDRQGKITNAIAVENGGDGITTGGTCHVSDSVASGNGGAGFFLGVATTLVASVAENNALDGVLMMFGSRATDCVSDLNGFLGGGGSGFFVIGDGVILGNCSAFNNFASGFESIPTPPAGGNSVHDCIATFNGFGLGLGDGFTFFREVKNCTANGNAANGIETENSGHIIDSTCSGNGLNGIFALLDGNSIRNNNVTFNGVAGIDTAIPGGGNEISGNRAHANGGPPPFFLNYVLSPGDTTGAIFVGPGILPPDGNANIEY